MTSTPSLKERWERGRDRPLPPVDGERTGVAPPVEAGAAARGVSDLWAHLSEARTT